MTSMLPAVDASNDRHPRQCTAHRRDGSPCTRWAIAGGTVCPTHGGSIPAVRRAARLRLLELVDPAIALLSRIVSDESEDTSVRARAAVEILDRAGYGRNPDPVELGEVHRERLRAWLTAQAAVQEEAGQARIAAAGSEIEQAARDCAEGRISAVELAELVATIRRGADVTHEAIEQKGS